MGLKLRYRRRAVSDIAGIRDYIGQNGSMESAEKVRRHLVSRIERLCDFPATGIRSQIPGIRILSPTRYPYRVYFTVLADTIVVLHVRHTARSASKNLK